MAVPGTFEAAFPPELVERYEIERPLGEGGMGTVYLARDREVRAPVALKLLRDPGQDSLVKRFLRECEILASIDHPGVVHVYEYGVTSGGPFLVMPYIQGDSLDRVDGLDDPEHLLFMLADALQAVHDHNVVHRDVKPANVMINRDGEPVLIDFGVVYAAELSRLTQTGGVAGTMSFLSPEILRGHKATPASDWYAWGVTSYMVVEGVPPYTPSDLFSAAAEGALPPPPLHRLRDYPGLAKAILASLKYRPGDRPQDRATMVALAAGASAADLPAAGETFHRITAPTASASKDPAARRFYEEGVDKSRKGDLAGARADLQRGLAYDDRDAAAWRELGIVQALDGRWEAALEAAEKALEACADEGASDPELLRLRALSLERCGHEAAAAGGFRLFLDHCPEDSFEAARDVAREKLEACQADAEKVANTFVPIPLAVSEPGGYSHPPEPGEAGADPQATEPPDGPGEDRYWERLVVEVPRCDWPRPPRPVQEPAEAGYSAALVAWAEGDHLEAENHLRRVALYHPEHDAAIRELGLLLVDQGSYQQALLPLRDTLHRNPEDYEALRFQGLAFEQLGRDEEAATSYRRFLELAPGAATRPRAHAERRLEALEKVLEQEAAAPPAMQEVPEAPPARRGGGGLALALVLVLGAGGAWLASGRAPPEEPAPPPAEASGRSLRVPLRFVGTVADLLPRVGGDPALAARLSQRGKDAAAQGAFDVGVPEADLRDALEALAGSGEPKALAPLWDLIEYPEPETRDFGQAVLLGCPTDACARALMAWAIRTADVPEGEVFSRSVVGLRDHPSPEAPGLAVKLLIRLFQATEASNSISARDAHELVVRKLRAGDPARLVPALDAAIQRGYGQDVHEELQALRSVLEG